MDNYKSTTIVLLMAIAIFSSQEMMSQQTGDDLKMKLRQSLKSDFPNLKPELKYQPQQIETDNDKVLKVSPTTKLPTKYDDLLNIPLPPELKEIKINMNVTNRNVGPVNKKFDYSTGKLNLIPDARSTYQFVNSGTSSGYTDGGAGSSIGGVSIGGTSSGAGFSISGDLDPVRAIQQYKRAKRQKKINRIKQAYGQ
ncbi:MAG: hypothetical protein LBS52_04160 [Dysgonamonadaceae bacterium]|jgi:hypothetical protein|nr:hypothetical protein [Dysgonamonadaceae bacterium]